MRDGYETEAGVPLAVVAALMSVASGAMDVTSFTRLGGIFSSVMTGNLVLFGLAVERASGAVASRSAVAIASYIVGVALGSMISKRTSSSQELWPSPVTTILVLEVVVLAGFAVGWELVTGRPSGNAQFPLLTASALAMGLQSEAMRSVGTTLSTTYLTGTLTSTVASLVTGTPGAPKVRLNLVILGSATVGAAAGAGLISLVPAALPVLPVLAVGYVVGVARTSGVRQ